MKSLLILTILFLPITHVFGQENEKASPFSVSGYAEIYYLYDFNRPVSNTMPGFMYSFNRHNEVNLNLGFIKGSYNTDNLRTNLALMTGTYANANLSAEPGVLKNIFEANVGVKISSRKNIWVDAGIFSSHIGFESAIGKDCWNLTRSLLADNSPYYESGMKLSYSTDNGKWLLSGMVLNGWQRIQRVEGNSLPSFGTQITFKPTSAVTINSSTFIGTDKPDSARQMRYFHNLYGILQLNKKLGLTLGLDYGMEEKSPQTNALNSWYSVVAIARYAVNNKITLAMRGEYYDDQQGVIISTTTLNGFKTWGLSANLDYQLLPNGVWRIEMRTLKSKDGVFENDGRPSNTNTFASTSLAVSF